VDEHENNKTHLQVTKQRLTFASMGSKNGRILHF